MRPLSFRPQLAILLVLLLVSAATAGESEQLIGGGMWRFSEPTMTPSISSTSVIPTESENNDTCAQANPFTFGIMQGALSPGGDVDWFSFQYDSQQGCFRVETKMVNQNTDTRLTLYDACGGTVLQSDDDSGDGPFSRLFVSSLPSGTYYFEVRGYANDTVGDYLLSLEFFGTCIQIFDPYTLIGMNDVAQSEGVDELVRFPNLGTGVGQLVGSLGDNFIETEALAVKRLEATVPTKPGVADAPQVEEIYAVDDGRLLRLDPFTGNGTEIGPIGFSDVDGIAFTPPPRPFKAGSTAEVPQVLYGVTYSSNQLIRIDTNTGQGTLVADNVISGRRLEDIAFDALGNAYVLTSGPRIYMIDIQTGEKLAKWVLEGAQSLESLAFTPTGFLYPVSAADRNGTKDLVYIKLSDFKETGEIVFASAQSSGFTDIEGLAYLSQFTWNVLHAAYTGEPVDAETRLSRHAVLHQNVPNPFNPTTRIHFELVQPGPVELAVYDIAGRHVVTLLTATRPAGEYSVDWNGRTRSGSMAAAGIYQYVLKTPQGVESRRMVLVK